MNKRNFKKVGVTLTALVFTVIGLTICSRASSVPSPEKNLIGTWVGETIPIVLWVNSKSIPVTIVIQPSGKITGMLGDAKIINGIVKNRQSTVIGKLFGHRGFAIQVKLQGNIIDSGQIHRDSACVLFIDYKDGAWHGSFNSSGSKTGGKNTMMLSTINMVLRKIEDVALIPL
jgi:hypothetical protein